jgi:predicted  nucleic acid-binding Zn-ribbon protein
MTWLEDQGAQAVKEKAQRYLRDLMDGVVSKINTHTTQEVERIMTELNRLSNAVDQELADDSAQNELIAELKRQLEEAKAAVDGAVAGEAAAKENLQTALDAATNAADRLESNDPQPEEPEPTEPA